MTNEEAINHGKEQLEIFGGEHGEFIKMAIKALESQKVGKWIVYEYEHFFDYNKTESKILMCSECETQFVSNKEQFIEWANYNIHYCPNCGCRMEGETNE